MGSKEMVKVLIEHKADGRIHPVTKYSPLYISCFKGWTAIVEILLKVGQFLSSFVKSLGESIPVKLCFVFRDRNFQNLCNSVRSKDGYQFMPPV